MDKITKAFPIEILKADQPTGMIEAIVSVMGNIDHGDDIIHNGAFTKTISERGNKVLVLDYHRSNSNRDVIGKVVGLREVNRDELPDTIKMRYPSATGGLHVTAQFDMDDDNARVIYGKLAKGFINEWSIGFSIPKGKQDYQTIKTKEGDRIVRNIREVVLMECSPVAFAMNSATTTISVKDMGGHMNEKRQSIMQMYHSITSAFESIYMDWEMGVGYYVKDVYTDNTMVVRACDLQTEYMYYMLGWQEDNGEFTFDAIETWQGGNFSFVSGIKSLEISSVPEIAEKIKDVNNFLNTMLKYDIIVDSETTKSNSQEKPLAKSQPALTKSRDERLEEIDKLFTTLDKMGGK